MEENKQVTDLIRALENIPVTPKDVIILTNTYYICKEIVSEARKQGITSVRQAMTVDKNVFSIVYKIRMNGRQISVSPSELKLQHKYVIEVLLLCKAILSNPDIAEEYEVVI